jgi:hypothetical protein
MPPAAARQGPVSGLAKLGALVLFVFGVLWALIGGLLLVAGGAIRDQLGFAQDFGQPFGQDFGDLAAGLFVGIGIVILFIALVEILAGIFAWRGSGLARFAGIVYGLVFGVGSLLVAAGGRGTDAAAAQGGVLFMAVFAIGYLYTLLVFIFRWRRAA